MQKILCTLAAVLLASCSSDWSAGLADQRADSSATPPGQHGAAANRFRASAPMPAHKSFANAPDRGSLVQYPKNPVVRRNGAYTWHAAELSEDHALRSTVTGDLSFTAPDGTVINLKYERHVEHPDGNWSWIGRGSDERAESTVITFGEEATFGTIPQRDGLPLRLTVGAGRAWVVSTDPRLLRDVHNEATDPTGPDYLVPPKISAASSTPGMQAMGAEAVSSTASGKTVVDVLVGFTDGYSDNLGGASAAITRIHNLVQVTNQAYVNAQVNAEIRLVHSMQISYPDATANKTALEELTGFQAPSTRTTPAAAFSGLRSARDQYGADLVLLLRRFQEPENSGCGIAWLIGGGRSGIDSSDEFFGYSVASDGQDTGTDGKTYFCREETFAHELGHNMGSQHDSDNAKKADGSQSFGVYSYSFGHKTTATAGDFYTVMAYGDKGQTNNRVFSNPNVAICGKDKNLVCGVANQADNARSLNNTIPTVASFRTTVVPVGPGSPARRVRSDVDADAKSDLLLTNKLQGGSAYWIMNGPSVVRYSAVFSNPAGHSQAATGDFDGDGKLDIVWARSSDRTLLLWQGSGTGFTSIAIRAYSEGWAVVGAGDVDGDGKSDLLLANASLRQFAYWTMNGANPVRYSSAFPQPAGHELATTGDFNGDGKLDLVWSRSSDRSLLMWLGDGVGFAQASIGNYSDGWAIAAAGDVDGDLKSDLILTNSTLGAVGYWIMNGAAPIRYSQVFTAPAGASLAATGDYNGDGMLDLAWSRSADRGVLLWQGAAGGFNQSTVGSSSDGWELAREGGEFARESPAGPAPRRAAGDVDGDAKSDLILAAQGASAYWIMSGSTPVRYSPGLNNPAGHVRVATGDFNGDGKLDIVWARSADRTLLLWQGDGNGFTPLPIRSYSEGWAVVGAGDVDGDGKSDLLLENASLGLSAYWTMNGATPVRYSSAFSQPVGYGRSATGDFNGDGKLDIVWSRSADRHLLMWLGDGNGFAQASIGNYSAGWEIAAAGDVDADLKSDLILVNTTLGAAAYWAMNGSVPVRYSPVFAAPSGALLSATGDYNGDGMLDLVWTRSSDRLITMWQGNGSGFASSAVGQHSPGWLVTQP